MGAHRRFGVSEFCGRSVKIAQRTKKREVLSPTPVPRLVTFRSFGGGKMATTVVHQSPFTHPFTISIGTSDPGESMIPFTPRLDVLGNILMRQTGRRVTLKSVKEVIKRTSRVDTCCIEVTVHQEKSKVNASSADDEYHRQLFEHYFSDEEERVMSIAARCVQYSRSFERSPQFMVHFLCPMAKPGLRLLEKHLFAQTGVPVYCQEIDTSAYDTSGGGVELPMHFIDIEMNPENLPKVFPWIQRVVLVSDLKTELGKICTEFYATTPLVDEAKLLLEKQMAEEVLKAIGGIPVD